MREVTYVTIKKLFIVRRTEKAVLVQSASGQQHWIPLSQCKTITTFPADEGSLWQEGEIEMTEWIAMQKGFIEDPDEQHELPPEQPIRRRVKLI